MCLFLLFIAKVSSLFWGGVDALLRMCCFQTLGFTQICRSQIWRKLLNFRHWVILCYTLPCSSHSSAFHGYSKHSVSFWCRGRAFSIFNISLIDLVGGGQFCQSQGCLEPAYTFLFWWRDGTIWMTQPRVQSAWPMGKRGTIICTWHP